MWYLQWTGGSQLAEGRNYLVDRGEPKEGRGTEWSTLFRAKSFESKEEALKYISVVSHWKSLVTPTFIHPANWHLRCERGEV